MSSKIGMNFEGSPNDFREKFNEEQIDQSVLQSGDFQPTLSSL